MATDVEEIEEFEPTIQPEPEPSSPFHDDEEPTQSLPRRRRGRPRGSKNRPKDQQPEVKTVRTPIRRTRKPDPLPSLLAMGWGTVGLGAATFGHFLPDPMGRAVPAAGRMMQLQSKAGAGTTLDKALRKTPIYASIKPWINALNPYAEIAGLFAGPLMVGAIAMRPEILALPPVQGIAMMVLLPAVRQASVQIETELNTGIGEYSQEEVQRARALLHYLVSGKIEEETVAEEVKPEEVKPEENEVFIG